MNTIKKIFINSIIIILVIIVVLLLVLFAQVNIMGKEYSNLFGYSFFQVETGSMENTIKIDDIVIVKINSDFSENDIITYKQDNALITHRLIKIDGDSLITKGDNNNTEDDPIDKSMVVGKVVFVIKNIGIWKKVFSNKRVIICLLITGFLFVIMVAYKEIDKKEEKKS